MVLAHTFNPNIQEPEAETGKSLGFEFKARLVYRVSSRTARAILKIKQNKTEKKRNEILLVSIYIPREAK